MAIFCSQLGKELPDDAEFCVKCGKPVGSAAKQAVEPQPKWEYCEVCCKREDGGFLGFVFKAYFWAKAVGPQGTYSAARSTLTFGYEPIGSGPDDAETPGSERKARPALDELVTKLYNDGWETIGKAGHQWYKYKFRRQVNQSEA